MPVRTRQREGQGRILFVAPHGHKLDDTHSDVMTEAAAEYLNSPMIINIGWKRDEEANPIVGIANCNDIRHCNLPDVQETFLKPIHQAIQQYNTRLIVLLHGMYKEDPWDAIVGFGNGKKPRYTCDLALKEQLVSGLRINGLNSLAVNDGKFSAHSKRNLAQALKSHAPTIQIEISWKKRRTEEIAKETGVLIGKAVGFATKGY